MPGRIPDQDDPAGHELAGHELAAEVADLLHQVNHRIRRQAAATFAPLGATSAQMRAMRVLGRCDAPIRMSELAEALGIVRRSATSVVDDLEHLGFARRVDDPTDRRAVGVELTATGRTVMADARRRRRTAAGQILGPLSDRELRSLRDLLRRLR